MTGQLEASIVRIFAHDGAVVGTGFLVSGRNILTCAHVVARALGMQHASQDMPEAPVRLDFPILEHGEVLTAHLIFWRPATDTGAGSPDGGQDIAALELDADPPPSSRPCRLVSAEDHWSHAFRAFGFPPSHDEGVWASGVLRGRQAAGWVQIEDLNETGYRVEPGFSGAAVWDEKLDGVAGMAVAAEAQTAARAAFIIPTDVLVAAWPSLGEQAIQLCPYRGLFAFREEDASLFFGRDVVVQTLFDAVKANPFVGLLGASGSGKSSVVFAGVVPRLRAEGGWAIASFRPGAHPHRALAAGLIPLLEARMSETDRILEVEKLGQALLQGDVGLAEVVGRILEKTGSDRLVLIVDQFEELYSVLEDAGERSRFIDLLLADSPSELSLVVPLRADFLGHALANRALADALQLADVKLGPMNPRELAEVVERPAKEMGVAIEEGLTTRILDSVGEEPGNLPLLEFTLTLLWSRQENGQLTHAAYDAMGGVEQALAGYAEEAYQRLSDEEKDQARSVFVQLVRPGEATLDTGRMAARSEIGEDRWQLVARLAGARLVVTGRDEATGVEGVEIVHEALISHWERLRKWMAADRAFRLWQERLRAALIQWEATKGDEGALLRGAPLEEATAWKTRRGGDISPAETSFIEASQSAAERVEREKEAARQRELEQAQTLASEQKQRAEQQARYARLRGRLAIALMAVLLVAVVAAGFASAQRNRAERLRAVSLAQRDVATSRQLAAQAEAQTTRNAQLATLLSVAALRIADTVEARSGLLNALHKVKRVDRFLSGHAAPVRTVSFSPDGKTLASGGLDSKIILWDVAQHSQLASLGGHAPGLQSVAFSPDGRMLASVGDDNTVVLWDVAQHSQLATLNSHAGGVVSNAASSVAFSPDGRTLASAGDDNSVVLWDVAQRTRLANLTGHSKAVLGIAFSPDGRTLAAAGKDDTILLWDVVKRSRLGMLTAHTVEILGTAFSPVAFSPDGRTLASAGDDNTVVLWDVAQLTRLATLTGHSKAVLSIAFSPDGRMLATGSEDKAVIFWDVAQHTKLATLTGHTDLVRSVAFSPDGRLLASASRDNNVILWTVAQQDLTSLAGHVFGVAFSPDGQTLATASEDKTAVLWNVAQRSQLATLTGHTGLVRRVAFSPDGRMLATAGDDTTVVLWDVTRRAQLGTLDGHTKAVFGAVFSPDGRMLATGGLDSKVILWDVARRAQLAILDGHTKAVFAVALSPDGRMLATGGLDGKVILWDVARRAQLGILEDPAKTVLGIAFSPDGRMLATATSDNTVVLWDAVAHTRLASLTGHTAGVERVAFSPDGRILASSSDDNTIILWDVPKRAQVAVLTSHSDPVFALAFSPSDPPMLASGGSDNTIILQDIDVASSRRQLCAIAGRDLTRQEWAIYMPGRPYQPVCK